MGDWSATRDHYNRQVDLSKTGEEALKQRSRGVSFPLKKFHNQIKRQLLLRFTRAGDRLLDLCCGRGGDIQKWFDCDLDYVRGIDLAPTEIEEAQKRWGEERRKGRRQNSRLEAKFEASSELGTKVWEWDQEYDVATCMFAIHYLFLEERTIHTFLQNVSSALKDGGYFIGTVPDGKSILCILNKKDSYKSDYFTLEKKWKGDYKPFGSAYLFGIADTVTGCDEYLVFFSILKAIAAKYSLFPVSDYGERKLDDLFDPRDKDAPFKHFAPHYDNSEMEMVSSLNAAFVFQKRSPPQNNKRKNEEDEVLKRQKRDVPESN